MTRPIDAVLAAVRGGRVEERRTIASATAPDFYAYRFHIDGRPATATEARLITRLLNRGTIGHKGFVPAVGPATSVLWQPGGLDPWDRPPDRRDPATIPADA